MLQDDGYTSEYILRLQPKRPWLRADGTLVGILPVDPFHYGKFRRHGWRVAPPDWLPPSITEEPVEAPPDEQPFAPEPTVDTAGTIVAHFPLPKVIRRGNKES